MRDRISHQQLRLLRTLKLLTNQRRDAAGGYQFVASDQEPRLGQLLCIREVLGFFD
jgi:hypothetical protein